MDGWMDAWMDGWTDRWTRADGQLTGQHSWQKHEEPNPTEASVPFIFPNSFLMLPLFTHQITNWGSQDVSIESLNPKLFLAQHWVSLTHAAKCGVTATTVTARQAQMSVPCVRLHTFWKVSFLSKLPWNRFEERFVFKISHLESHLIRRHFIHSLPLTHPVPLKLSVPTVRDYEF